MLELTIPSHENQHFDEFVARWLIEMFAKPKHFLNGEVPPIGADFSIFDEHLSPEQGGGRIPEKCSATLVAEYLEMVDDHRLWPLLRFTLRTDENSPQLFDLASIILMFRRLDDFLNEEERYQWVEIALKAYWKVVWNTKTTVETKEALAKARAYNRSNYTTVLADCNLSSDMGNQAEKLWDIVREFLNSNSQGYNDPWDIVATTRMVESQLGAETAFKWFKTAVQAVYLEELLRLRAGEELRENFKTSRIPREREDLLVMHGETDNPLVAEVARSKDTVIVIQKCLNDQVLILSAHKKVPQELMDLIYKNLRALSRVFGDPDNTWYPHAGGILNGGKSRPNKPATKIPLMTIVRTVIVTTEDFYNQKV